MQTRLQHKSTTDGELSYPAREATRDSVLRELSAVLFGSLPRSDQRRRGMEYVQGLLGVEGRKSIRNISSLFGGEVAEQSLHHFISGSTWDWGPVRRALARHLEEVSPAAAGPLEPLGGLDGALLMLVPPGTRQAADATLLTKVETLARTLPVAVDGGVTPEIAHRCRRSGTTFVVSGRSLLSCAPATVTSAAPNLRTTLTTERRTA